MPNAINWFEIPATDFARAKRFYEAIFAIRLMQFDPAATSAMFPADWQKGEVGGSVTTGEGSEPGTKGVTVFLNGGEDLAVVLGRVAGAGGKVLLPKTQIPMEGAGYMALFLDTEGNKIGLHSMK